MPNVTISAANLPEGMCPPWLIPLWANTLAPSLSANLNGALNVFNYGSSTPAPADQDKPWRRLNADGTPDKWYDYSGGGWIAPHALLPGSRIIAPAALTTEAQIWAWDGGDGSNPATTPPVGRTGAMWEVDPDLSAKFPLGAGELPMSHVTKVVGDTGGEENHSLIVQELAAHHHNVQVVSANIESGSESTRLRSDSTTTQPEAVTDDTGAGVAHNTMPPYRTVYFIRRTNRLHYVP